MGFKIRHGHYSEIFEEEVLRIKKLYKDLLGLEINWTEATAIAGKRSNETFWTEKKLKEMLAQLRGIN